MTGEKLARMKPDLPNVEMVNDYSKGCHHNGVEAPSTIDEQQLRCHVSWALQGLAVLSRAAR